MSDKTDPWGVNGNWCECNCIDGFWKSPWIYYPWTRNCVHSLYLVIWCTSFSFVIFEQRELDGLQFDDLELHHSPSWTATLVVSSGLFWHPHWIQVWKDAFHSGVNYKFSARWHFKVAMGITMQHVLWVVKIISNRLKKCKEKPMV